MAVRQKKDGRFFCYYTLDGKRKEEYFGRGLDAYVEKRLSTQQTVTQRSGKRKKAEPVFLPDGKPKMVSRSSVNRELCDIQAIMNWAVGKKYLLAQLSHYHNIVSALKSQESINWRLTGIFISRIG